MHLHLLILLLGGILCQVAISYRIDAEAYPYHLSKPRKEEFFTDTIVQPQHKKSWKMDRDTTGGSRYIRRPGKKHLNKHKLLALLGDDYREGLMSIDRPTDIDTKVRKLKVPIKKDPSWSPDSLKNQLRRLNLTAELEPELLPFQSQIRKWLRRRSTCPIEFSWEDMGELYWPRWIRTGKCLSKDGLCSFPNGMSCVPDKYITIQILAWTCNRNRNKRDVFLGESVLYKKRVPTLPPSKKRKKMCSWKKVTETITTECFCTC